MHRPPIHPATALLGIGVTMLLAGCYQSATHAPPDQAPPLPSGRQTGGAGGSGAPGADHRDADAQGSAAPIQPGSGSAQPAPGAP